jgi:hypothetical protein
LEENTSTTAKNIAHDLSTLRITAHDQLRFGTSLVVVCDLFLAIDDAFGDRVAKGRFEGVVEEDVFIIAALVTVANGFGQHSLSSWVGLVISLCEKDVDFFALGSSDAN